MKPYMLDRVVSVGGEEVKKFLPATGGILMTAAEAANLTELMRDVVVEGTGSSVRTDSYTVAAKTGTAEFETEKRHTPGSPALHQWNHRRSLLQSWWRNLEAAVR